jgi:hypothetical protein
MDHCFKRLECILSYGMIKILDMIGILNHINHLSTLRCVWVKMATQQLWILRASGINKLRRLGKAQSLSEFQTVRCLLFFVCLLFCLLCFIVFCLLFWFVLFLFAFSYVFLFVFYFVLILIIFNFPMNEGLSTS